MTAVQCELDNFLTLVNSSIPVPLVSLTGSTVSEDKASQAEFCRHPHTQDAYEAIFVEVRQSRIKDAGQGLFAKTGDTSTQRVGTLRQSLQTSSPAPSLASITG